MRKPPFHIGYLAGCYLILVATGCVRHHQSVRVGDYEVTRSDAQYRDAVIRQYYPSDSRNLGLSQLIKAYTYAQILKNHGQEVTEKTLQTEAERIDLHTKAPEALGRIKAIFGRDYHSYLRVFVLPNYVQHALYYDFFLKDGEIQNSTKDTAQRLLELSLKSADKFENLARTNGLNVGHFSISPQSEMKWHFDNGVLGPSSPGGEPREPEAADTASNGKTDPVLTKLRGLEAGQIYSHLIERPENWMIVKKTGERRGQAEYSSISVPKADFDTWLSSETKKVRIIASG